MTCSCCVWVYQFTPLGYAFINDEVSSQGIQGTREGHIMKNPTSVTWKRHWLNFWFWPGLNSANMPSTTFAQQALCKQGTIREKKLFTIDNHLNDSPSCFYKANDTRYQSLDQKIYQLSCTQENNRAPEICAEVWYAEASPGMVNSLKIWTSKACSSQQKSHEHPKSLWHKRVAKGSPMKALTSRAKIYQTRTTRYLLGILRWHHDRNFWLQVANSMMGTLLSTIFCYQVAVMLLTPPCSKHLLDKTYSKIKQELQI